MFTFNLTFLALELHHAAAGTLSRWSQLYLQSLACIFAVMG
jgi:hypothetical protein